MIALMDTLRPKSRVFVPGLSGESPLLLRELAEDPERASGVDFIGVQYPGIGRADYLGAHPKARQTAFFMSASLRIGIRENRASLLSFDYASIARYMEQCEPFDVAVGHFSLPDSEGWCSAGISQDFLPIAWPRAIRRVAHLNPSMPRMRSGFRAHLSEMDVAIECDLPLFNYSETLGKDQATDQIAAHAAALIRDGDTLQFGVGAVPLALARSLASHRKLKLHTGMISPAVRSLEASGALQPGVPIITGVVLGDAAMYDWAARHTPLQLCDVRKTHAVQAIAATPRFIAINSAMEVDLFGQINGERGDGTLQAGAGGLPCYAQGALASKGGRLLICMTATARRGTVSRIVPVLGTQGLCILPRHMVDVVITEHGAAQIRDLPMDARAEALMAIAAPEHRAGLQEAWQEIRSRL